MQSPELSVPRIDPDVDAVDLILTSVALHEPNQGELAVGVVAEYAEATANVDNIIITAIIVAKPLRNFKVILLSFMYLWPRLLY
jgi:hypothetical protein